MFKVKVLEDPKVAASIGDMKEVIESLQVAGAASKGNIDAESEIAWAIYELGEILKGPMV